MQLLWNKLHHTPLIIRDKSSKLEVDFVYCFFCPCYRWLQPLSLERWLKGSAADGKRKTSWLLYSACCLSVRSWSEVWECREWRRQSLRKSSYIWQIWCVLRWGAFIRLRYGCQKPWFWENAAGCFYSLEFQQVSLSCFWKYFVLSMKKSAVSLLRTKPGETTGWKDCLQDP